MNLVVAKVSQHLMHLESRPTVTLTRGEAMACALRNGLQMHEAGDIADVARSFDVMLDGKWVHVAGAHKP